MGRRIWLVALGHALDLATAGAGLVEALARSTHSSEEDDEDLAHQRDAEDVVNACGTRP